MREPEPLSGRDELVGAGLGLAHVSAGALVLALDQGWGIYVLGLGLSFWAEGIYRHWRSRHRR